MERKDLSTFLCLVFITLSTNAYSGEVEDIIRNEAVKLNQNVPVMLDTYLRLDIVSAYKRTLVYNATILDDPSDRKSASEIENEQRKHICSMGSGDLALQRNFKWLKENNQCVSGDGSTN